MKNLGIQEKEIEKRETEKEIEQITKYFLKNFGDDLISLLGTTVEGDKFHLHIETYTHGDSVVRLIEEGNYSNLFRIDIDLGRINVYDNYDFEEAEQRFGDGFDEEMKADAYYFFIVTFPFEDYIKEKIEEQLTSGEIRKLFNLVFSDLYLKEVE